MIDRLGLSIPLAAGLGLFALGLVIGGLAPSMEVLGRTRAVALTGFNARELQEQNVYGDKLEKFLKDIHLRDASPSVPIGAPAHAA